MKHLLSLLFVLLASNFTYAAPVDNTLASVDSIEKLLVVTQTEKVMETMFQNMDSLIKSTMNQSFQKQNMSAEGRKIMDAFMERMILIMKDEMSWERLKPLYIQIYSETFTQEEIDDLLAFYASQTGQAFVEKMPVVMQKTMAHTQARMGPMMQRIQAEMKKTIAEVAAANAAKH